MCEGFISYDRKKLWDSGVMGDSTPRALQNTTFFIVGKMCPLRGGEELATKSEDFSDS